MVLTGAWPISRTNLTAAARDGKHAGRADAAPSPALRAQVAQLVEQRTENPRVLGSIPSLATTFNPLYLRRARVLLVANRFAKGGQT